MKAAAKQESGTLIYDFFINRDTKDVLIIEKYQDDEAFMAHMKRFVTEEYIPTLLTMHEIASIKMPGLVTKEIEDFFTAGGWKYKDFLVNISQRQWVCYILLDGTARPQANILFDQSIQ